MAPGLVGPEKAARGKTPTDVWWHTIVPTSGREKTGYPTQKPLGILRRIVRVHSEPNDVVLDFFAGSGTTGEAAALEGRRFVLVDDAGAAVKTCKERLERWTPSLLLQMSRRSRPAKFYSAAGNACPKPERVTISFVPDGTVLGHNVRARPSPAPCLPTSPTSVPPRPGRTRS